MPSKMWLKALICGFSSMLVACGASAPVQQPLASQSTTVPTSIPPTLPVASPIATIPPPTATLPPPTFTPIPPTPTTTGGLSEGATLTLGEAQVRVVRIAESTVTPVFKKPASSGMKFVLVELKTTQLPSGKVLGSEHLILKSSTGKEYEMPRIYGNNPTFGDFEGGAGSTISVQGADQELKVFFEVAQDENVSQITLTYR